MTLLDRLIALKKRRPPWVFFLPDDPWPRTPTLLLRQAHRFPGWGETEVPDGPPEPGPLWLPGLGEAQGAEAVLVDLPPEWGETFPGRAVVAHAIARVDPTVRAVPLHDAWVLAIWHAPPDPPILLTCAFWLASRQRVYASAMADVTDAVPARDRVPWILALAGLGPPEGTPVQ